MKLKELYESSLITSLGPVNITRYKKIDGTPFIFALQPRKAIVGHNATANPVVSFLLSDEDIKIKGNNYKIKDYNYKKAKEVLLSKKKEYKFPKDLNSLDDEKRSQILSALIIYNKILENDKDFFNKYGKKEALEDEINSLKSNISSSLGSFASKNSKKENVEVEEKPKIEPPKGKGKKKGKTNLSPENTAAMYDDLEQIKKVREEIEILNTKKISKQDLIKEIDKAIEDINGDISIDKEKFEKAETTMRKNAIQKDIDDLNIQKAEKEKEKQSVNKEIEEVENQLKTKTEEYNKLINEE